MRFFMLPYQLIFFPRISCIVVVAAAAAAAIRIFGLFRNAVFFSVKRLFHWTYYLPLNEIAIIALITELTNFSRFSAGNQLNWYDRGTLLSETMMYFVSFLGILDFPFEFCLFHELKKKTHTHTIYWFDVCFLKNYFWGNLLYFYFYLYLLHALNSSSSV